MSRSTRWCTNSHSSSTYAWFSVYGLGLIALLEHVRIIRCIDLRLSLRRLFLEASVSGPGFRSRVSGSGFRAWGLGARITGSGSRGSGLGFWASGPGTVQGWHRRGQETAQRRGGSSAPERPVRRASQIGPAQSWRLWCCPGTLSKRGSRCGCAARKTHPRLAGRLRESGSGRPPASDLATWRAR
jgi:hypothetical protein